MSHDAQRILLVEDNPGDARLIRELLSDEIGRAGFHMQVVESLEDALAALGVALPDVVFLDLSLPDSFGLETLYRLQSRAPTLPVIVLTGNEDQQLALSAVKAGAQDYLVKNDLSGRLLVKTMKYAQERKAIEASLRVSEARFRSLADLSSDWYWEQDALRRLAYLSEGFAEKSGLDPQTLLSHSWWDLAHAGAEADWDALRAALDARQPFHDIVIRYPTDGGGSLHISISGVPVTADDGQTVYRGLGKDVSARERAAAALRGSEERFRRIMDTGRDGILMTDAEGHITFANRRVATMLGHTQAELAGLRMDSLMHDAPLQPDAAGGAHDGSAGVALRRSDGSALLTMQTTYPVHGKDGQHAGTLTIVTDITEFKQREERVQQLATLAAQKSEAERASAAKSRFMAAVSHDLRQPMHALGLFLDDLRSIALPPQAAPLLEHMESALHSTQSLLDAILVISRLESGLIAPNFMAFPLQPVLERLRRAFSAVAQKKNLSLRVLGSEAVVFSDPALLERILANLVSNALRYTDHGGVVLGCRRRGQALQIEVWDTGLGIAPEHQEAIFREFFRIERADDNRGGLGLGLAIVQSCTQLLGYTVTLKSVQGRGSRFSLQVPLGQLPAHALVEPDLMAEDDSGPATFAGLRVLVVDDDALILERTARLLERWGCSVIMATSGPQAEALLARESASPDLIISDLRLDHGELGTEVVQRLRARLRPNLPALLLTGDTSLQTARDVRRSGLTLLYKPVPPAKLRIVMKNLLGS
ncbi:MAG: response regulator [Ramlibacter sp.]